MFEAVMSAAGISLGLGVLLGHAAGYARRGWVEEARRREAVHGGPRYVRGTK